jgi:hypothetical protein
LIREKPRKAEAGFSTILRRAGKTSGVIKIKASGNGLISGEMEFNI